MRIIQGGGYSDEDKRKLIPLCYQNVFLAIQSLLRGAEILEARAMEKVRSAEVRGSKAKAEEARSEAAEAKVKYFSGVDEVAAVDYLKVESLSRGQAEVVKRLWADTGVQAAYKKRNEFQVHCMEASITQHDLPLTPRKPSKLLQQSLN